MGSSSSSRSSQKKTAATNPLREHLATALALCSSHRYASLGMATVACALLIAVCWGAFSSPAVVVSDDEEEFVEFDEIDGLEADLDEKAPSHPIRVPTPRAEQHTGFDNFMPTFASTSVPEPGIVAAMFEDPSRSVETGPVWLAGTIETDDFTPQENYLPAIPTPVSPTAGPLLTPP